MSVEPEELTPEEEPQEPVAHVRVTYTGPVAPHWEITGVFGDEGEIEEFRQRAIARLQLLPPHDPQFRRNRERVNRDAERELFILEWDLGYDEDTVEDAASLGDKPSPTTSVEVEAAPEGEAAATPDAGASADPAPESTGDSAAGDA